MLPLYPVQMAGGKKKNESYPLHMAGGKNIFNPKPPLLSLKSGKKNIMAYLYQTPYFTLTMTNDKTDLFFMGRGGPEDDPGGA